MSIEYYFSVPDISCMSCVNTITTYLERDGTLVDGSTGIIIQGFEVILARKQIRLIVKEHDLTTDAVRTLLNSRLEGIGFSCYPAINTDWYYGFAGVGAGLLIMLLPLITGPLSVTAMAIIGVPSVLLTAALGAKSYRRAFLLAWNRQSPHMDTLFAVSTLTAMIASISAFFIPGMPMMFESGLLIFGFRYLGEAIRSALEARIEITGRFQDRAVKQVNRLNQDGSVTRISLEHVLAGDLIELDAGDVVSVDGVCDSGDGSLETVNYNGNPDQVSCSRETRLYAGMKLLTGKVQMRVNAPASESSLAQQDVLDELSRARKDQSSWETGAGKILQWFIPLVFVLAVVSSLVAGLYFSMAAAIQCLVAVLVSACPCTLGLVTGVAVQVGMEKAAGQKMIFKSTRKLEEADQIQQVVFDLHGTLTTSIPEVKAWHSDDPDFFDYIAAIEEYSKKATGMAIYQYAAGRRNGVKTDLKADDINENHVSGITATINQQHYVLGNWQLLKENGIDVEAKPSVVYLARGKTVLGEIELHRPLRTEAAAVVDALDKMGKQVFLCTGADELTAGHYAGLAGIPMEQVRFSMSPSDKVNYIQALQKNGPVAMIGDEINDASALLASDFGIAMPTDGKDSMTRERADAESRVDSLLSVIAGFEVSRQTSQNIRQSLVFNLVYNVAALSLPTMLLMFTGMTMMPGACVVLMFIQTGLILLNTQRFKQQELLFVNDVVKKITEEIHPVKPGNGYDYMLSKMPRGQFLPEPEVLSTIPVVSSVNQDDTLEAEPGFSPMV